MEKEGRKRNIDNRKRFKTQVINKIKESIKSTFRKSKQEIIQPANQKDIYLCGQCRKISKKTDPFLRVWVKGNSKDPFKTRSLVPHSIKRYKTEVVCL